MATSPPQTNHISAINADAHVNDLSVDHNHPNPLQYPRAAESPQSLVPNASLTKSDIGKSVIDANNLSKMTATHDADPARFMYEQNGNGQTGSTIEQKRACGDQPNPTFTLDANDDRHYNTSIHAASVDLSSVDARTNASTTQGNADGSPTIAPSASDSAVHIDREKSSCTKPILTGNDNSSNNTPPTTNSPTMPDNASNPTEIEKTLAADSVETPAVNSTDNNSDNSNQSEPDVVAKGIPNPPSYNDSSNSSAAPMSEDAVANETESRDNNNTINNNKNDEVARVESPCEVEKVPELTVTTVASSNDTDDIATPSADIDKTSASTPTDSATNSSATATVEPSNADDDNNIKLENANNGAVNESTEHSIETAAAATDQAK